MAKKKKLIPDQEIQYHRAGVIDAMELWGELKINGGCDPSFPDGVIMNRVRNLILHHRFGIAMLCVEHDIPFPPEDDLEVPPIAPGGYMASLDQTERVERLGGPGYVLTTEFQEE